MDDSPESKAESNADMWATAEERREEIVEFYRRVPAHSDATIAALGLDSPGTVAWWGPRGQATLQLILVHLIFQTERHAGQADIVRELIDGQAGIRPDNSNLPDEDEAWWSGYREQVEAAARVAGG